MQSPIVTACFIFCSVFSLSFSVEAVGHLPEALLRDQENFHVILLQSLGATEDTWTPLLKKLKNSFKEASLEVKENTRRIFPNLVKPTLSLWPPHFLIDDEDLHHQTFLSTDCPAFERLNEVIKALGTLSENSTFPSDLLTQLQALRETYRTYSDQLCCSTPLERSRLLSRIPIKTEFSDQTYLIPQQTAVKLLAIDKYGIHTKKNQAGSSIVTHVEQIYAKQNLIKNYAEGSQEGTLNPAFEWAMSTFHNLLFEEGFVSSMLLTLADVPFEGPLLQEREKKKQTLIAQAKDMNLSATERRAIQWRLQEDLAFKRTKGYVLQITPEIKGEHLAEKPNFQNPKGGFLNQALQEESLFDALDRTSVQELILSSFLTHPADAKGDNLIVTWPDKAGKRRIVSIDNDLSLSAPVIEENPGYHSLEARNILWMFPQLMEKPLEESVRRRFLFHTPSLFLLKWFKSLDIHNDLYNRFVAQGFMDQETYSLLGLPLRLREGTASTLLDRMTRLQDFLKLRSVVRLQELFQEISPLAALYCKGLVEQESVAHPDQKSQAPLKAFEIAYHQTKPLEDVLGEEQDTLLKRDQTIKVMLETETTRKNAYKVHEQCLEAAILDLLKATNFPALEVTQIRSLLEEAVTSWPDLLYQLEACDFKDPYLLHHVMKAHPSETLLRFLFYKFPEARKSFDEEGFTPLHHAIVSNVLEVLPFLKAQGVHFDEKTQDNRSPLDLACQAKNHEAFCLLVKHRARELQPDLGVRFYHAGDTSTRLIFSEVCKRNAELKWFLTFDLLFPVLEEKDLGFKIQTATFGERYLPFLYQSQLFHADGKVIRRNTFGRRDVGKIAFEIAGHSYSAWLKSYPELPGLEEAVGSFMRKLFGRVAPYTELIKINTIPFLVSQGIEGPTLKEVLNASPVLLNALDSDATSALLLSSMLINPEDGKPDNYVLEKIPDREQYRLIPIDNDHAFVPGVAKEQSLSNRLFNIPQVQVKTILYCLDQMQEQVSPLVRKRFLSIDIGEVLEEWLRELRAKNALYGELFPVPEERIRLLQQKESYIGIPFPEGSMKALYQKMSRLQRLLHDKPQLSHLDLLCHIEPYLGHRYKRGFTNPFSPLERLKLLDEPLYKKNARGEIQTITSSGDILRSMNIPLKESLLDSAQKDSTKVHGYRPRQALQELREIKQEEVNSLLNKMKAGVSLSPQLLKSLRIDDHVSRLLKEIDFKGMNETDQRVFFDLLKGRFFQELSLKNASALRDSLMLNEVNLENLLRLDLRGALGVTDGVIPVIAEKAPSLLSLNVSRVLGIKNVMKKLQIPLLFPSLQYLNLNQTNARSVFVEGPCLQKVKISGCRNLEVIKLISPILTYVDLRDSQNLEDQAFIEFLKTAPSLKECLLENIPKLTFTSLQAIKFPLEEEHLKTFNKHIKNAKTGDAVAQRIIGLLYHNGRGVIQDYQEAMKWYRKAAAQGDAAAQYNIGTLYDKGQGVIQDYQEAMKWFFKAANQGLAMAQCNIGALYDKGQGVIQDYQEAMKWYRKAAAQGDAAAQYNIGVLYAKGQGVIQDYQEAMKWWLKAADQGDAAAQYNIGVLYDNGQGVIQNYQEAMKWYLKAADQELAVAQCNIGALYRKGQGVIQDYQEAMKWYLKAADQELAVAQYNIGTLYHKGQGVIQDYQEAMKWFFKAANQGLAMAQCNIGVLYANGQGVVQDYQEAMKWYRKAADQGYAAAQYNIGGMYKRGLGVERHEQEAQDWFQKAFKGFESNAQKGSHDDKQNLGNLYRHGNGVKKDLEKAFRLFQEAAELGNASAQSHLGCMYKEGIGVEENKQEALKWIQKAADQDVAIGLYNLGLLYRDGEGVAHNDVEAVKYFQRAADQSHADACYSLRWMYEQGRGEAHNQEEALKWYQRGEKWDADDALYSIGRIYEYGLGVETKLSEAMKWYRKAAELMYEPALEKIRKFEE